MSDRYPDQFEDDSVWNAENLQDTEAVLELDRVLDALESARVSPSDDPLLSLFSAARAELDAAGPGAAPRLDDLLAVESMGTADATGVSGGAGTSISDVGDITENSPSSVVSLGRHRHRQDRRRMGFAGRAAATGGLSVTGMVIAGGVAAAIAVGGFSVAAYHGAIPGMPALNKGSAVDTSGETSSSTTLSGSVQPTQTTGQPTEEPRELAPDEHNGSSEAAKPSTDPDVATSSQPTSDPSEKPSVPSPTDEPSASAEPTAEIPEGQGDASSDKNEDVEAIEDQPAVGSSD